MKKALNKLKQVLVRIIPYNRSYRPTGVYPTIDAYLESGREKGAASVEIYPAYISSSAIPEDFLERCTKFHVLPAVAPIPASRLVAVPNGRLYSDGVQHVTIITAGNKLLGEVTYQNKPSNNIEENVLLKQNYFIPARRYKGVVFHTLIGGSGSVNYYHWLIDSLARIHLLKQSCWYDRVDWFLIPGNRLNYQRDSLRMLGIPEEKMIIADRETHIQADVLLATTYVRYYEHLPAWCCNFLRESFLKPETFTGLETHPFVYISRKDAKRRLIVNEPELLQLLDEYGFRSFELTSLSFSEKIQLFHQARVIVGTLGAGHTNLVFCKSGTDVLEILPEVFAFPDYYYIAEKVDVRYSYVFAPSVTAAKTVNQRIRSNIKVDLDEVRQKLDQIMARHRQGQQLAVAG